MSDTEHGYLIITHTQTIVKDASAVGEYIDGKRQDWQTKDPEEFQRLIDTGVGTFRNDAGAESVRILRIQEDGESKAIEEPLQ